MEIYPLPEDETPGGKSEGMLWGGLKRMPPNLRSSSPLPKNCPVDGRPPYKTALGSDKRNDTFRIGVDGKF